MVPRGHRDEQVVYLVGKIGAQEILKIKMWEPSSHKQELKALGLVTSHRESMQNREELISFRER